ncbi:PPOX class F420-dependent oxidoreductase [Rudaeicoccus suwonensis]|uniref:PPOX class probable F420-dependent enzyme n=1 Tax=Rudaeicoccus suwonensis TaxID=657409 RepID=A0A561E117_9MICO|nr:PPOX class F420-dependent oxidoreductase [Rudaeicoccus suwonensis]TWE09287.1 PPOX class probable F420-dependent enzyme [Rudaeicoccus suwonensis]
MDLPENVIELLRTPALCYVATVMPDGSPQVTQTWVDTDGQHIVINIVDGMQKAKNFARDPRVAVAISDPRTPAAFAQIRGRVAAMTTDGGVDSINALAHKYTGKPYAWYGGREQTRLIVTIEADHITDML